MFFSHQHLEIEIGNVKLKQYWNDQCGSVQYRAFSPNAQRERLATVPDTTEIHTNTIKSEDLTPFLRHWSFQDEPTIFAPTGAQT